MAILFVDYGLYILDEVLQSWGNNDSFYEMKYVFLDGIKRCVNGV